MIGDIGLRALLTRLQAEAGPDRRLDGELDGLVDHENEAWPPRYTADPMYLQQVTKRLGLDAEMVSKVALNLMSAFPDHGIARLYAIALVGALIAKLEVI